MPSKVSRKQPPATAPGQRTTPAQLPSEGFVREATILALVPVSRATWWLGVRNGIYPKPVRIAPRCVAWRVHEIRALLDNGIDLAAA
jgi:prophage regulatory protein